MELSTLCECIGMTLNYFDTSVGFHAACLEWGTCCDLSIYPSVALSNVFYRLLVHSMAVVTTEH